MSDAKHSPGPWDLHWRGDDAGKESYIATEGDKALFEDIAIIPHDDVTDEGIQEVRANARLIAAAPDLLAACKRVLADDMLLLTGSTQEALRTAVAAAKGGAP